MAEDNVTITLKIPGRPVDQPALPRALQSRLRARGRLPRTRSCRTIM